MACVNPDGTLTASATQLLKALTAPLTAEEISQKLQRPLFKVRSSIREMTESGLVAADGDRFSITEEGRKKI